MKQKIVMLLSAIFLSAGISSAEEAQIKIRRIDVDDNVYTPLYRADTEQDNQLSASGRWLRLTVEYTNEGGWIDELAVEHLALVPDHGSPNPVILSTKVTYMNISPRNHVSYVYMHPNCVKRYESKASDVESVVRFYIKGAEIASEYDGDKKAKELLSKATTAEHKGHLLDESETPFWFINYDFKEMIKRGSGSSH
jgi:hypothetical protein